MAIEVLTVSPEGQLVIPESMMEELFITAGTQIMAYSENDFIMLKTIMPNDKDFENMLDEAQKWAKEVGYKEEDITDIIKSVRKRNHQMKNENSY